jgi:hypothetical protein
MEFTPTKEQIAVIDALPLEKVLVLAGAGTGKTETLVHKIEKMIDQSDIASGNVLVLTFSRAAVRELKKRMAQRESEARFVRARTFDSFATRLLCARPSTDDISSLAYEERIRLATNVINSGNGVGPILADYKHLIVDEMQDLVGDRQLLVQALIRWIVSTGGGFTLFSDPAQSIYDWHVKDSVTKVSAASMLEWLRKTFTTELRQISFDEDFRFETAEAKQALWARAELMGSSPNYESIYKGLNQTLRDLRTFRLTEKTLALRRGQRSVAILTRTNAHALLISQQLHAADIKHAVQRDHSERCLAPWLAVVFRSCESPQMTKEEFLSRCSSASHDYRPPDPDKAWWFLLKRVDRSGGRSLNLSRISVAFAGGDYPDELTQILTENIMVSTVHRAKGLQFPTVLVADPSGHASDGDELEFAGEARVLYVALTRAKKELERLDDPRDCRLGKDKFGRLRLYRYTKPKGFPVVVAFEVTAADVDTSEPAYVSTENSKVLDTQKYIEQEIRVGDVLAGNQITYRAEDGNEQVRFMFLHKEKPVAITSTQAYFLYKEALRSPKAWGDYKTYWPRTLRGLRVEGIDTVAGSAATSFKHGLGTSGLWLRVRVSGLAEWDYIPEKEVNKK